MNHDELLTQATCAVLIEGQIVGTAWLVSDEGHLLTAGHVLGTEQSATEVQVRFVGDVPRAAHKLEWMYHEASGLDFAILKLIHPVAGRRPLPISLTKKVKGQFRLCGYGTMLRHDALSSSNGRFLGVMHIGHSASNTLLRLHSSDLGQKGYSGGAVFSDELKAVVGIQTEAANARIGPESQVILALPLYRVAQLWPALNLLVKKSVERAPSLPVEPHPPKRVPLSNVPAASSNGSLFAPWKRFWQWLTGWLSLSEPISRMLPNPSTNESKATILTAKRTSSQSAHLFICYKRHVDEDQQLAHYLHDFLTAHGHQVFIDHTMRAGTAWLQEIDRQIRASDFLVVLLSPQSADSEMVQAEIRRANEYRKSKGRPHILPIRLAYEGLLPYAIDVFLDPLQYVIWQGVADNERVAQEVLAAIEGDLPQQAPIQLDSSLTGTTLSEDGRVVSNENRWPAPLPKADPRFLEKLSTPGAAVTLRDTLYVARAADAELKRNVLKMGSLTTIRAPHQTGKTSLFVRGIHHAHQHGCKVVQLDMQRVDQEKLETYDGFLRYLANYIVWKLRIEVDVAQLWRDELGSQDNLSMLLEDHVLPATDKPVLLAIDEVDRLLKTDFHTDFFALLRSWHDSGSYQQAWRKLNLLLVISTEPHLLITNVNQSPFNVGLKLDLQDFNEAQVRQLNQRHGSPVPEEEISDLMRLLNGQPYLTRQALYTLVKQPSLTWRDLKRIAATEEGPFASHLRHYNWLINNKKNLKAALKQIIEQNQCRDEMIFYRLRRAGLVKGSRNACSCRCDLYRIYFEDKV